MAQAILVSDNEIINSLYELNLRAYVAVNVTVKSDLVSAIKLLEHSPNVDAIISFKDLTSESAEVEQFNKFLLDNNLNIPFILLGEQKTSLKNSIVIKNKYDIKSLLKGMAKILELTAQQMASREVPKYFPVPLNLLKHMAKTHCDLYTRTQNDNFDYQYTKILDKEKPFGSLIKMQIDKGQSHLYIDALERLRFINKTSGFMITELSRPNITNDEKLEIASQGLSMVAEEIFENPEVSEAVAEVSNSCVKAMSSVVKDVPKLRGLLAMLMDKKEDFIYKHGILAAYISKQIIENISWGSKEQVEKVAFALFFHDIFLVPIFAKYPDVNSEEDLLFRDDVSEEDKEVILNHAKLAGALVQNFPRAPMGVDMIIIQHHGMTSGRGFAVNYKDDISPLARIIIIAEDAATGILQDIADGKKKEAVDVNRMIKRLDSRYNYQSYKKIIACIQEIEI